MPDGAFSSFDPGQVVDPGRDLGRFVVAEAVQFDQVETPLGLGRFQPGDFGMPGRRQDPLPGARIEAPFLQQSRTWDVDTDQDKGDVHAHECPQQVEGVLIIGPVEAESRDVVQQQRLGSVVVQGRGDLPDQVGQVHARIQRGPVEAQDGLAGALRLRGHRCLHVGDGRVQVAGPGDRVGVQVPVHVQPGVLERRGDLAGRLRLALVAAAGDHHPGPGGRLMLERVAPDPPVQQLGNGLGHRGLQ